MTNTVTDILRMSTYKFTKAFSVYVYLKQWKDVTD